MRLISEHPAATRRVRWLTAAGACVIVACGTLLVLRPAALVALWTLLAAALLAHLAGRRASDCSVLAELDGWSVGDLATPLAVIPAQSASPLHDLSRIRMAGGGVVVVDGVPRVVTERRVEQLDVDLVLPGRWSQVAVTARQIDAEVHVDHLRRLPDEDEVWVVRDATGVRMISGDGLRAAAAAARRGRVTPLSPSWAAERPPTTAPRVEPPDDPRDVDHEERPARPRQRIGHSTMQDRR